MPVRSSVCTYSPASVSSATKQHSLSIGHYKPLSYSGSKPTTSALGATGHHSSLFKNSHLSSPSFTSPKLSSSPSRYTPSTGYSSGSTERLISGSSPSVTSYRPLGQSCASTSAIRASPTSSPGSRYSSSGSSSISSLASDHSSTGNYHHTKTSPSHSFLGSSSTSYSLRRLSYTVSLIVIFHLAQICCNYLR